MSEFCIDISQLRESHSQIILDILSLQENGLYLSKEGYWKILNKKRGGGKLKLDKLNQAFQSEESLYNKQ